MQKIAIGILSLLVLFLAALNTRLEDRARLLEGRLAAAEKKAVPKTASAPVREEEAPTSLPAAAPEAMPKPAAVAPSVQKPDESAIPQSPGRVPQTWTTVTGDIIVQRMALDVLGSELVLADGNVLKGLRLTDEQRKYIDLLIKDRDARVSQLQKEIGQTEAQTELSIRNLLRPGQLAAYDARSTAIFEVQQGEQTADLSGVKPGFLGVSGSDAPGGGSVVSEVFPNTAASSLGMLPGDVILEFNGEPVAGYADLSQKIRTTGEGVAVNLKIRRGGTEYIQGLQLGPRPK